MPVSLNWVDREKAIIYIIASGHLSPDEVLSAAGTLREMAGSVPHPVGVIIDARNQTFFSRRYGEMLRAVHRLDYPNLRIVVFVGKSFAWELFSTFARQVGNYPYQFAVKSSFAEARSLIQSLQIEWSVPPSSSGRWN